MIASEYTDCGDSFDESAIDTHSSASSSASFKTAEKGWSLGLPLPSSQKILDESSVDAKAAEKDLMLPTHTCSTDVPQAGQTIASPDLTENDVVNDILEAFCACLLDCVPVLNNSVHFSGSDVPLEIFHQVRADTTIRVGVCCLVERRLLEAVQRNCELRWNHLLESC
eukprot:3941493-Rhodomonas_salina.3